MVDKLPHEDSLFGLLSLWNDSVTGGLQACKKSADKVKQRIKTIPFGFDKMLGRFFRCQCRSYEALFAFKNSPSV